MAAGGRTLASFQGQFLHHFLTGDVEFQLAVPVAPSGFEGVCLHGSPWCGWPTCPACCGSQSSCCADVARAWRASRAGVNWPTGNLADSMQLNIRVLDRSFVVQASSGIDCGAKGGMGFRVFFCLSVAHWVQLGSCSCPHIHSTNFTSHPVYLALCQLLRLLVRSTAVRRGYTIETLASCSSQEASNWSILIRPRVHVHMAFCPIKMQYMEPCYKTTVWLFHV